VSAVELAIVELALPALEPAAAAEVAVSSCVSSRGKSIVGGSYTAGCAADAVDAAGAEVDAGQGHGLNCATVSRLNVSTKRRRAAFVTRVGYCECAHNNPHCMSECGGRQRDRKD